MATVRPSTVPVTPLPVADAKFVTSDMSTFRSRAPATMAAASGCSLTCLQTRGQAQQRGGVDPGWGSIVTSFGLPSVSVPVLSTTMRRHLLEDLERLGVANEYAAFGAPAGADHDRHRRRQTECAGARDDQDSDRIDERVSQSRLRPIACDQTMNVTTATAMTIGTNQPDTVSASR